MDISARLTLQGDTQSIAKQRQFERAAYVSILIIALVVRLIGLGDRVFHHDESQDAYFSWAFSNTGDYEYQPLLHGPLRFYLTALVYQIFGDSDFTARLAPALMGTAMVALPYFFRNQLGKVASLIVAGILAIGPSFLYFSRFAREDIYVACLTFAMIAIVARFFEKPKPWHPTAFGVLLGASFATKESTFITVFVWGSFVLAVSARDLWAQRRSSVSWRRTAFGRLLTEISWEYWIWGVVAFAAIFSILFTVFLTNPGGLWDGIYEGLHYWLSQQDVGRGGETWYFYLFLLFADEWPMLLFGAIGVVITVKRPTLLRLFLAWSFLISLIVYSWASEKFAWLILHPLLPLILLAGMGAAEVWRVRATWYGRIGLVTGVICVAYVALSSWYANVTYNANPRETLVSTQTAPAVKDIARTIVARGSHREAVLIDSADGGSFPWAWYLRHINTSYVDLSTGNVPQNVRTLIVTDRNYSRIRGQRPYQRAKPFPFRVWWVRDYGAQSPAKWWRWFILRRVWNPTGGVRSWLLES